MSANNRRGQDRYDDYDDEQDVQAEPISQKLEALANDMIDYGLDNLGDKGSLITTLAVEDGAGNREMLSFDDENIHECVSKAHDVLMDAKRKTKAIDGLAGKPERYAIAYDGAIREDDRGPYKNALIIEYGERGLSSGYSAYLLYKKAGKPKDFVWTDPAAAGETDLFV